MKVYNKSIIDCVLGQQLVCLTLDGYVSSAYVFGQHIRPQAKQNSCCPRTPSMKYPCNIFYSIYNEGLGVNGI